MNKSTLMAVWLTAMASVAQGGEGFEQQYGSHAHGAAQLDLVLDKSALLLQLRSPAINLLGFEHRARSEAELHAVEAMLRLLQQPDNMIDIAAAAGCTLQSVEVEQELMLPGAGQAVVAEHEHEHEHEAQTSDGDGEGTRESHTDVDVSYEYHCTAAEKLESIGVTLFARFPGIESLDVRLITPHAQRSLTLDSHHTDIGLR